MAVNFTLQDIKTTLESVPLLKVEELGRQYKCKEGITTILCGHMPRYLSLEKLVIICKKINPYINWSFPTMKEINDFFYTINTDELNYEDRKTILKIRTNPNLSTYFELWDLYDTLKNKKTECDTQCSV